MKRFLCLLLVMLFAFPVLAEPRYPARSGAATDAAAVLSVKVLDDLRTLDKRLNKADAPRLIIVTVDFLDGSTAQAYADALFARWELKDDEALLLLAVGEDSYALSAGKNTLRLIPHSVTDKLLASALHEPFMNQQYDAAIAAFVPAWVAEVSKACGVTIKTTDLFRSTASGLFGNWAGAQSRPATSLPEESILTREDKGSGFSLLKVLIIVALLLLLFGSFRKVRHDRQPSAEQPTPEPPRAKSERPVYFKPREKRSTPQYFHPRKPRQ